LAQSGARQRDDVREQELESVCIFRSDSVFIIRIVRDAL
jgi:hypothetical protein